MDLKELEAELAWLKAHPEFEERPATIEQFLGERYLNIEKLVRRSIRSELIKMFGKKVSHRKMTKVQRAIFTGAIGIGKTTVASIVLPYMAHWCLCVKDPQRFFGLLPGSRIAFMMMSTSEKQAREVLFADVDARIKYSPWFSEKYPKDPSFKNQIRFPQKDIWIVPGDSQETTFEGYNILGGIIDEADSHKVTEEKDYADVGFDTINSRVESRFQDRGFVLVIGQMKKLNGFASRKFKEFTEDENAYAARLTIWESFGWDFKDYINKDGTRNSFFYDTRRKQIVPTGVMDMVKSDFIIEIPTIYRKGFETNPEKSLRDLAGIPPAVGDPFISLTHKIDLCVEKWTSKYGESPVGLECTRPVFKKGFRATDSLKRTSHIDIAYSANGDALGLAMGHIRELVEIDDELKPVIVYDFLCRIKAAPGTEIMLSDVRHIIYDLRDEKGFKLVSVTMDGFQSTDTMQQLRKRRFVSDYLSVDRQLLPYYDLRDAIYEERVEFPKYVTYLQPGSTERVEIAVKELQELEDDGKKVDHPEAGSKDVADAMAGVCYLLMGDRQYRRGVTSLSDYRREKAKTAATGTDGDSYGGITHPAMVNMTGLSAPIPPTGVAWGRPGR